jgi:protein TonB
VNGVSTASCIECPTPDYNDLARKYKIHGTIVLDVVVGADGRAVAVAVRPEKLLGAGLDEQAVKAVKTWKFKPATDATGQPVSVIVPVEIRFEIS